MMLIIDSISWLNDQGTSAEVTVVKKLNQGSLRPDSIGRPYSMAGPFLGTFLGKQKGTNENKKDCY